MRETWVLLALAAFLSSALVSAPASASPSPSPPLPLEGAQTAAADTTRRLATAKRGGVGDEAAVKAFIHQRKRELHERKDAKSGATGDIKPEQIRLGIGADWQTERYVTWVTFRNYSSASPPVVQWWWKTPKPHVYSIPATTTTYDKGYCVLPDDCGWHGFIHTALLKDLPFPAPVSYRVGSDDAGFSPSYSFATAANRIGKPNRTLTAAVFGDMGALPGGIDGARTTMWLEKHKDDWDMIVDAGDIA
jgi:Purple acid Phosphatase, N-terminal domain